MSEPQSLEEVGAQSGGEDGKEAKEGKRKRVLGTKGRRCLIVLSVLLVLMIAACLLLMFLPCLPPNLPFPDYNATLPKALVGSQLPKDWLSGATPVSTYYSDSDEDESTTILLGPESLARRGEILYTGLLGGHLVHLSPRHGNFKVSNVTDFGEECEDISEGSKCGRPMGMRFHSDGFLYVTDAYLGLYKVNVETGEKTRLAKSHFYISGRRSSLPNDLDIAEDGTVFWSDASTNVKVEDVVLEFMSEPSGRLIRYDPVKQKSEAIIKNVQCANGVQLSPEEDFVLVAEGGKDRILRYYLKGPNKGTHDIFVDGLPGIPDKIRSNGRPEGGYLVWCIVSHGSARNGGGGGGFLPWLRGNRMIRTMLMRGLFLLEKIFKNAHDRFGDSFSRKMVYALGNLAYMGPFLTSEGLVLELDAYGNITGSFYSGDGSVSMASEMHVLPGGRGGIKGLGNIYIGSPVNPYLLQVPIKEGKMLEMAMAYSRANTWADNSTLLADYRHDLEQKLNLTTTVPTETNEVSNNTSSSIQSMNNVKTSGEDSAAEKVSLSGPNEDKFNLSQNEDVVSNLTQVEDFSKGINYVSSTEGDNSNQPSTESLLDSFFATATMEKLNAVTQKSLENVAEEVSNETEWQSSLGWNQTNEDKPVIKRFFEDDSGNMVLEYPVFRTENENKRKDANSLGNYNQSITESVELISQDERN